jgi:hypothetical protein
MNVLVDPPYEGWGAILRENLLAAARCHSLMGVDRARDFRQELVETALRYSKLLASSAAEVGISLRLGEFTPELARAPIVMAGHQPIIYHPGILYKIDRLSALADSQGALGINLVVDLDEGDGGALSWPCVQGSDVVIKRSSISVGGAMFCDRRVADKKTVASVFEALKGDLIRSGRDDIVSVVESVSDMYIRLAGMPIALANAIVRMRLYRSCYLEAPLSSLIRSPVFKRELIRLVENPQRFISVYNHTLSAFRAERKIKNPANPFPNMRTGDGVLELPLWELRDGERKPVLVESDSKAEDLDGKLLAPRGSLVTLLSRALASDLFIHGVGGGKYEPFIDAFAAALLGIPLPRFVVASATRHLFPESVERFSEARRLKSRYKEIVSHTETFFGSGILSVEDEVALSAFVQRRRELLESMSRVRSPSERSQVAYALNEINREVKARIDVSALAPVLAVGAMDDSAFGRWAYREFPFFFFQ